MVVYVAQGGVALGELSRPEPFRQQSPGGQAAFRIPWGCGRDIGGDEPPNVCTPRIPPSSPGTNSGHSANQDGRYAAALWASLHLVARTLP